jgi:hypothetical protein
VGSALPEHVAIVEKPTSKRFTSWRRSSSSAMDRDFRQRSRTKTRVAFALTGGISHRRRCRRGIRAVFCVAVEVEPELGHHLGNLKHDLPRVQSGMRVSGRVQLERNRKLQNKPRSSQPAAL